MNSKNILEQFRDLKITREELESNGSQALLKQMSATVVVCNCHLINLLEKYISGKVKKDRIIEWVNTIWFSDAFYYCEEGCDCISSIMNKLEELDEDYVLNVDVAKNLIAASKKNIKI